MTTKPLTLTDYQAFATAIPKFFPNYAFLIANQTLTTAQVVTMVNALVASEMAIANARSAVHTAVVAGAAVDSQYLSVFKELREIVAVAFSNVPSTLAEFAMVPRKVRAPLTTAARLAADVKAAATRKARGTTSKKQKALITGGVTGVQIIPTTPVAPATAPAAASSTSGVSATPAPATAAPAVTGVTGAAPHS
jgi:hypothetical protein